VFVENGRMRPGPLTDDEVEWALARVVRVLAWLVALGAVGLGAAMCSGVLR
jgi:hypothetical protein